MLGYNAGSIYGSGSGTNTTGQNSVMIGYDVRPNNNGETNEIVIAGYTGSGNGMIGNGSNTTTIGNGSNQQTFISGAITVTANTAAANVTGTSSTIAAQNATTATYGGGNLNLTAGNAGTTGLGGNIVLTPGTSSTAANNGIVQVAGQIKITGGAPAAGKVLTSDANGLATWSANPNTAIISVTSSTTYTVSANDKYVIYSNSTTGTITLPDATSSGVGAGKEYIIKNISVNSITINTTSTQKIIVDNANNTATSATLGIEASNNWIRVISDGTQWIGFRALF
jgi:hypothetical protein